MTTRVVIGCNAVRDYEFLAPMTGLMWRYVGFEPLFLLCGEWSERKRSQTARRALLDWDMKTVMLAPSSRISDITMSQASRLVAAALPEIGAAEWLMPGDADLWPLTKDWYYQHYNGSDVTCYYANGDHYQTYPMCHVAMRKSNWLRALQLREGEPLESATEDRVVGWLARRVMLRDNPGLATWVADQGVLTEAVRYMAAEGFKVCYIEREGHPPKDRIDRACWPVELRLRDKVDAHVLRPADQPENWPRVRELFVARLPQYAGWVDKYREEYVNGY
jgi:hypothetical protein